MLAASGVLVLQGVSVPLLYRSIRHRLGLVRPWCISYWLGFPGWRRPALAIALVELELTAHTRHFE